MANNYVKPRTGRTFATEEVDGVHTEKVKVVPAVEEPAESLLRSLVCEIRVTNKYLSVLTNTHFEVE